MADDQNYKLGTDQAGLNPTDRLHTEEFLMRADKVAAVGQLASGVAHEIRTPLSAIQWNLQVLRNKHPEDDETYQMILSELERIGTTVDQLLSLARFRKSVVSTVDPVEMLNAIVRLLQVQANRAGIQLIFHPAQVGLMEGHENQLKQVFVNLLINALDATPAGGTVDIKLALGRGGWIHFEVSDTGIGIPPEVLLRVGEAFFTTKPDGTGLGLMISRKIIAEHGGQLEIQSELNKGTTIVVTLPRTHPTSIHDAQELG